VTPVLATTAWKPDYECTFKTAKKSAIPGLATGHLVLNRQ